MQRNIKNLTTTEFDLLIVGAGINGAVLSWQASLAGLSVAIIDQGDFGHATSANSQKIIHGGLRYLQDFDIIRIKQSLRERGRLMRLAPHLVHPLPCAMPLYGHGIKGKESMWLGLRLFDLIGKNRNHTSDPSKHIPPGKILSRSETNLLIPHLEQNGLKGAAQWYDAMCYNTERLVLSFIKSAYSLGAVVANYVKAIKITQPYGTLIRATSKDTLTDQTFDIRAKHLINITGPWVSDLIAISKLSPPRPPTAFACGINIITDQLYQHSTAIALRNLTDNKSRLYFIVPWRGKSIIGTEWFVNHDHPNDLRVTEGQCSQLINSFNAAYPSAKLSLNDILHVHGGLVPYKHSNDKITNTIPIQKHFEMIDHSTDGIKGMISVIGVKYTTGGDVGEKVLRYMFPSLSIMPAHLQPQLKGGTIEHFSHFKAETIHKWQSTIGSGQSLRLLLNYGTETEEIIKLANHESPPPFKEMDCPLDIVKGTTLYAIREEMAQKLSDIILRRTDLSTTGPIPESLLTKISLLMAQECSWTDDRRIAEIEEVLNAYPGFVKIGAEKESVRYDTFDIANGSAPWIFTDTADKESTF